MRIGFFNFRDFVFLVEFLFFWDRLPKACFSSGVGGGHKTLNHPDTISRFRAVFISRQPPHFIPAFSGTISNGKKNCNFFSDRF